MFQRPLGDKDTPPDILDSGHPEDRNECILQFPGGHHLRGYYVHVRAGWPSITVRRTGCSAAMECYSITKAPRRGPTFVTRKITRAVAHILAGKRLKRWRRTVIVLPKKPRRSRELCQTLLCVSPLEHPPFSIFSQHKTTSNWPFRSVRISSCRTSKRSKLASAVLHIFARCRATL